MESDGALKMYQRSAQIHVRYNPFIRDGDNCAYATAGKSRPCGPSSSIYTNTIYTMSQSKWVAI